MSFGFNARFVRKTLRKENACKRMKKTAIKNEPFRISNGCSSVTVPGISRVASSILMFCSTAILNLDCLALLSLDRWLKQLQLPVFYVSGDSRLPKGPSSSLMVMVPLLSLSIAKKASRTWRQTKLSQLHGLVVGWPCCALPH